MISNAVTLREIRGRNLRNVALVSLSIEIGVVLLSAYLGFTQSPLLFISGSAFAIACGLTILALRLGKRGDITAGAWALIAGFGLGGTVAATILSDIGPMTGMVILLFVFLIVIQTMSPEAARWGFLAGSLISVVTGLLVFFPPFPPVSLTGPEMSTIVLWTGRAAVLGMIALILSQYRNLSLNNKILTAFLSIAVIVILSITAVLEITTTRASTAQIGRELNGIVQARGTSLGNFIGAQLDSLRLLALDETMRREITASNNSYTGNDAVDLSTISTRDQQWQLAVRDNQTDPFISGRLNSPLAESLRLFRALQPQHVEIFVTDAAGALVAASNLTSDYYQGDETWWQNAHAGDGQVTISAPQFDESSGTLSILFAIPVYDQEGETAIGILRSTMKLDALNALVRAPIGETGATDIYFPELGRLFHEDTLKTTEAGFDAILQAVSQNGYAQVDYERIDSIVSAAAITTSSGQPEIDRLGWIVIAHQDWVEAAVPVKNQIAAISFFGTVMLGIAALLSAVVAHPLTRPILGIIHAAGKITQGELSARAPIETRDEIGALAETFNDMTARLQDTLAGLEKHVAERTAALEEGSRQLQNRSAQLQTIAEVAQTAAAIQDIDALLPLVTRLVSERFGHYHVGIFLLDEKDEYAILRAANSEGGQRMLARRHRLRIGQEGVVGFSISQKYAHIALDVGQDAVFFSNPDLPNTHSEIALPLIVGSRVIGALDVQSEHIGAFSSEDAEVLTTLANQVAIAIENARLFEESKRALAELDRTFQRYTQSKWEALSTSGSLKGYLADEEGLRPIDRSRRTAKRLKIAPYQVPIRLRGVTIGTLDIQTGKKPEQYSEDEIAIAEAAAERVALALENARLIEESQRRAATERAIGEITSKISGSVNLRNVLRSTVQELGRVLPGSEVIIQFQREQEKKS